MHDIGCRTVDWRGSQVPLRELAEVDDTGSAIYVFDGTTVECVRRALAEAGLRTRTSGKMIMVGPARTDIDGLITAIDGMAEKARTEIDDVVREAERTAGRHELRRIEWAIEDLISTTVDRIGKDAERWKGRVGNP
ncbi:hypothetical protein ACWEVD_19530 [Nocardia thailandica]